MITNDVWYAFQGELVSQSVHIGLVWAERGRNVGNSLPVLGNIQRGFSFGISNLHVAGPVYAVNQKRNHQIFLLAKPLISSYNKHPLPLALNVQNTDISDRLLNHYHIQPSIIHPKTKNSWTPVCLNLNNSPIIGSSLYQVFPRQTKREQFLLNLKFSKLKQHWIIISSHTTLSYSQNKH